MEPTLAPQPTNPARRPSAHFVYGIAIIILALVLCGLICVVADIQIPYFSRFYAPVMIPPAPVADQEPVMRHAMAAVANAQEASTSTSAATATSTSAAVNAIQK